MGKKRWIAIRIDESLLDKLEKIDPYSSNRTELIVRRIKKGGRPLF